MRSPSDGAEYEPPQRNRSTGEASAHRLPHHDGQPASGFAEAGPPRDGEVIPFARAPETTETACARPLVSVIIPAWNAGRFIALTLASAQAQTWPNLEIIVVDDGSTDGTAAIVEAAAATDPRIALIHQPNAGVAAARNRAIAEARGEYVAPLDADDLWHPENVQAQVEALERAGPGTALSYAWYVRIDALGHLSEHGPRLSLNESGEALARLINRNVIGNGSSAVIRRDCLLSVGGYDPSLRARAAQGSEDLALYLALAERWSFTTVRRTLIGHRRHKGAMSRDVEQMVRSREIVLAELEARRPDLRRSLVTAALGKCCATEIMRGLVRRDAAILIAALRRARARGPACLGYTAICVARNLKDSLARRMVAVLAAALARMGKTAEPCTLPADWQQIEAFDPVTTPAACLSDAGALRRPA